MHNPADDDALRRMRRISPHADPTSRVPTLRPSRVPRHIAIIMDGNGRWAQARNLPRSAGHRAGAESVRRIVAECGKLGVEALTLFSFSSENWRRPRAEIDALMELCVAYCRSERDAIVRENVRLHVIGDLDPLDPAARDALRSLVHATKDCTGPTLCLAVNYGSRAEIASAVRALAVRARDGHIDPDSITERDIDHALQTAGLPDPDLLIRTAGERRLSNFLLWQLSYAEIHVTDTFWPDFDESSLHAAVLDFASRHRRFGGLDTTPNPLPAPTR